MPYKNMIVNISKSLEKKIFNREEEFQVKKIKVWGM